MPHAADASTDLRAAVGGVRAFLLDLDGVIVLAGEAIPGAAEALTGLERRGMPYRIVTNTSAVSRETLSRWSAKARRADPAGAVRVGACRRRRPGRPARSGTSRCTSLPLTTPRPSSPVSGSSRTLKPVRPGRRRPPW
jgi:hypothetical protein